MGPMSPSIFSTACPDFAPFSGANRRIISSLLFSFLLVQPQHAARAFDFDTLRELAAKRARNAYVDPPPLRPAFLNELGYDQYRDIRFRADQALWRSGGPFQVQFFHPGFNFKQAVAINTIEAGQVRRVAFASQMFDYGQNRLPGTIPADLGFAGFRLHAPTLRADYFDEVVAFLGASYFRAVGAGQHYGLSARGLAIDTATPGVNEEFPWFREFWLRKPESDENRMTVYALLDSQSVVGAYEFIVYPGAATRIDVRASVYLRKPVAKLALAPLTSMYLHGQAQLEPARDYRPQVHDSDGLLVETGRGEWIWRPLNNGHALRVMSFRDTDVKGFGLMQRDRDFDHYQDLEARYDNRPSAWIEPVGNWGDGEVQLVEIPAGKEYEDNIVAYWVPRRVPAVGKPLDFAYRLYWYRDAPRPPAGYTAATRVATASVPGGRKFVLDFAGGRLPNLGPLSRVRADISVSENGRLVDKTHFVEKNTVTGGWRAVFEIVPRVPHAPVELRVFLRDGKDVLTETWSYLWNS